jgi:hypothetical protein
MSFFTQLGSALDQGITTFLREMGSHVTLHCPKCAVQLAAPIGARVRCVKCNEEFTVDSAGKHISSILQDTVTGVTQTVQAISAPDSSAADSADRASTSSSSNQAVPDSSSPKNRKFETIQRVPLD